MNPVSGISILITPPIEMETCPVQLILVTSRKSGNRLLGGSANSFKPRVCAHHKDNGICLWWYYDSSESALHLPAYPIRASSRNHYALEFCNWASNCLQQCHQIRGKD